MRRTVRGRSIGCLPTGSQRSPPAARAARGDVRVSLRIGGPDLDNGDRVLSHRTNLTRHVSLRSVSALAGYLPAELSAAQHLQRGNLPIPRARFRSSMLLPSMHRVLSWCFVATGRVEYQGRTVGMMSFLSKSL